MAGFVIVNPIKNGFMSDLAKKNPVKTDFVRFCPKIYLTGFVIVNPIKMDFCPKL